MTTDALPALRLGRFERWLRRGLWVALVGVAVLLVWLGLWLERPFHTPSAQTHQAGKLSPPSVGETALSTEVAR